MRMVLMEDHGWRRAALEVDHATDDGLLPQGIVHGVLRGHREDCALEKWRQRSVRSTEANQAQGGVNPSRCKW